MRIERKYRRLYWLAACLACMSAGAWAAQPAIQPLDSIRATAEQHLRQLLPAGNATLFLSADKLDSRLRLPECSAPLAAFLPSGANLGARATVGVRCAQGQQWTLYVPVAIETETPVLVLRRPLAQNNPVTTQDVELQSRRVRGLSSAYLTNMGQLKGQHLKHSLPMGTILSTDALAPDVLVKRGQQVTLLAMVGGIEVRANGVALTDGAAASRVQVQNLSSLKVVEGTVDTDSVVRVNL